MEEKRFYLIASGVIGVISFFIPFYSINLILITINISGYKILESLKTLSMGGSLFSSDMFKNSLSSNFGNPNNENLLFWGAFLFLLLGPIVFFYKSIKMILYGIIKKYYDCGTVFLLSYIMISIIITTIIGAKINNYFFFFSVADIGYYLSIVTIIFGHNISVKYLPQNNLENNDNNSEILTDKFQYYSKSKENFIFEEIKEKDKTQTKQELILQVKKLIEDAKLLPERLGCPYCHATLILDRNEREIWKFNCPTCKNNIDFIVKSKENFLNKGTKEKQIIQTEHDLILQLRKLVENSELIPAIIGCPFCHTALNLDRNEREIWKFNCHTCKNIVDLRTREKISF